MYHFILYAQPRRKSIQRSFLITNILVTSLFCKQCPSLALPAFLLVGRFPIPSRTRPADSGCAFILNAGTSLHSAKTKKRLGIPASKLTSQASFISSFFKSPLPALFLFSEFRFYSLLRFCSLPVSPAAAPARMAAPHISPDEGFLRLPAPGPDHQTRFLLSNPRPRSSFRNRSRFPART